MEIKVDVSQAEVDAVTNASKFGVSGTGDAEVQPAEVKVPSAKESLKARAEDPASPGIQTPKDATKAPKEASTAPVAPAAKDEPGLSETELKELESFKIPAAYLKEADEALDDLKSKLGSKYDVIDEKLNKYLASKNFEKLCKGGFTAAQAVTQLALQAQGFVLEDPETTALVTRKIEELKDASQLRPAAPAPVEVVDTEKQLMHSWKKGATARERQEALTKLLNVDESVNLVKKWK